MSHDRDDPFALLGLPRRFDLAPEAIEAAYLTRSAALHPDRVAAGRLGGFAQREAGGAAATVNHAHDILADDERRANALLLLLGGPSKEQDKSLPDGFLIDIMDIRQEMEVVLGAEVLGADNTRGQEASPSTQHSARSTPSLEDDRKRLQGWAAEERQTYVDHVAKLFAQLESGQGDGTSRDREGADLHRAIRRQLNAWRYIERMIEQLDPNYRAVL